MAGLIFGTTDFKTSFNLEVTVFDAPPATVREVFEVIPGQDGHDDINDYLEPRLITVEGFISGSSNADLMTKLINLEAEFYGSYGATPDPNFIAPTRAAKDLRAPGDFGGRKFPNCRYRSMTVKFPGDKRTLATACSLVIRFKQSRPFTVAA